MHKDKTSITHIVLLYLMDSYISRRLHTNLHYEVTTLDD